MTHSTFGVSASCFAANMSVKQNAADYAHLYPSAAHVVETAFYVDDCLTGADSYQSALATQATAAGPIRVGMLHSQEVEL